MSVMVMAFRSVENFDPTISQTHNTIGRGIRLSSMPAQCRLPTDQEPIVFIERSNSPLEYLAAFAVAFLAGVLTVHLQR